MLSGRATARTDAAAVAPPGRFATERIHVRYARTKSAAAMTAGITVTRVACGPNQCARGTISRDMIPVPNDAPVKNIAMPHSWLPALAREACATAWGWNAA